jgi:hypothetical protein
MGPQKMPDFELLLLLLFLRFGMEPSMTLQVLWLLAISETRAAYLVAEKPANYTCVLMPKSKCSQ